MILLLRMGCGVVVEITNPSSFSCVLTDSYLAVGGDVQPTGQTLKDVVERWPEGVKTHDVEYICGAVGRLTSMVAKLNSNQNRDAKLNKRSTSVLC